jgi:FkbM family methyltransferase
MRLTNFLKSLHLLGSKKIKGFSSAEFFPSQPSCQIPNLDFLFRQFLGERDSGTFVEIGANDGISCSNTWGLSERGWTGFMVEPITESASACRKNHKGHPLVSIHQYAIGSLDDVNLSFAVAGMLTTANPNLEAEYVATEWATPFMTNDKIGIQSKKLDTFLAEIGIEENFDVLVVDVEGFETEVFAGFSLDLWRPKLLIVELVDTHPDLKSTSKIDARLGRSIQLAGYTIVYKDYINTVFIRDDVWEIAFRSE